LLEQTAMISKAEGDNAKVGVVEDTKIDSGD
jgi:hypothetical protein